MSVICMKKLGVTFLVLVLLSCSVFAVEYSVSPTDIDVSVKQGCFAKKIITISTDLVDKADNIDVVFEPGEKLKGFTEAYLQEDSTYAVYFTPTLDIPEQTIEDTIKVHIIGKGLAVSSGTRTVTSQINVKLNINGQCDELQIPPERLAENANLVTLSASILLLILMSFLVLNVFLRKRLMLIRLPTKGKKRR